MLHAEEDAAPDRPEAIRTRIAWGALAFAIAVFIFLQSSGPAPSVGGRATNDVISYLAHFGLYGTLAFSAVRAAGARTPRAALAVAIIASVYGATDEVHQYFVPSREASVLDFAVDVAGALVGAMLARRGALTLGSTPIRNN